MVVPEPQISRLLDSLSGLIGKRVELTASRRESDDTVISAIPTTTVALRTSDGSSIANEHREFMREMLRLIQRDSVARAACALLEDRIQVLERQNSEFHLHDSDEESNTDPLTGLYTRAVMLQKLDGEMNRAWRHGSPVSLLMIDIDHFKDVNESYGLEAGDQVLREMGQILRDSCRAYDVIGRYGGEEFALVLPQTPVNKTRTVAERIRKAIESRIVPWDGREVSVTSSIGVAGLENIPEEVVYSTCSLVERADRALFIAKDKGRNRIETWTPSLTAYRAVGIDH